MTDELKKISLDATGVPGAVVESAHQMPPSAVRPGKKKRSFVWVWFIVTPLIVLLVAFGILGFMLLPVRDVVAKAKIAASAGKEAATAIKNQDLVKTKSALADARQKFTDVKNEYAKLSGLKALPFLGVYIKDGEHALAAGFAGLDAGDRAIEALEPNADILGLKGKSTFVSGTADDRIQTAVKTMTALIPKINEMAVSIDVLRKELDQIDPNRYPEKIGETEVRSKLISLKETIDNAATLFVNAQPLLTSLPSMLGEPVEKRYLVLFQNDKELRATGGFITAYAQFRLVRGKAVLEKADDIYSLDNSIKKKFQAPREILTFHKGVYELHIRDSNLSPDFKESMKTFEELYNQSQGKEKIDGIWAVDTHVLVEALKILGPEYISGREFSAETDKRCDCPKAVYELEDYSTRPVGYVREARKDIIGVLLQQLLQKALGVSPSQYWGRLFQMLIAEINEKHVLGYFHDEKVQKAAESFNLGGRIMQTGDTAAVLQYEEGKDWDYLHVNNSNMAGAKSNMFVSEKYVKDVTVNADGTITTKLTIDYKNPYPGSDCNLERGGLCLNAPLRNWIRVYTPVGSKLGESKGTQSPKDGKPSQMETYEALGKTVFEGFLIINPLGSAKLELTYSSPVKSQSGSYKVLIQKQPGTDGAEFTLKLDGKERKKFPLKTDTEIVIP